MSKNVIKLATDDFANDGYISMPSSEKMHQLILAFIKAWRNFCDQSLRHKKLISFENDRGYEHKGQEHFDQKENFHFSLDYRFENNFNPSQDDENLLRLARILLMEMQSVIIDTAQTLRRITGEDFEKHALDKRGLTLRALHYFPTKKDLLAKPHPDKGGHTFHLYDSVPGLEVLWPKDWGDKPSWQSVVTSGEKIIIFPGLLGQFVSKGELKALCHRVKANEASSVHGRYSLVMFNDYHEYSFRYDKGVHKSTQKVLGNGENYTMPFEDFAKFFKQRELVDAM